MTKTTGKDEEKEESSQVDKLKKETEPKIGKLIERAQNREDRKSVIKRTTSA